MFVMRQVTHRLRQHWCVAPLILIGVAEAALGIFQYYAGDGIARGTFINRDHFAGLLEMTLPFPVMWAAEILIRRGSAAIPATAAAMACGLFTTAAVILLGVIHSLSRMGFMASLLGLFAVA